MAEELLVFSRRALLHGNNYLASSFTRSFGSGFYFSLWDYVKAKVYETRPTIVTGLNGDFGNALRPFC